MEITYVVVISLITYCLGSVTKAFFTTIPTKFIPLQNVVIGIISAIVCYFGGLEGSLLNSFVLCLMASMGAGGISDLSKVNIIE